MNVIRTIKSYVRRIRRTFEYLPIIWNGFDFDYQYSLELFSKQLERQAKYLERASAYSSRAKQDASRIRTAISLINKVYDDTYEMEWVDKLKERFGDDVLDWVFVDMGRGDGSSYTKFKYEEWDNAEEIEEMQTLLSNESRKKQKKAEKILWEFIGHNIRYWWE